MNAIDGILFLIILAYGVAGYLQGFLKGFAALFGLAATFLGAWFLYPAAARHIGGLVSPAVAPAAAFLGLWIAFYLVYVLLLRVAYRRIPKAIRQSALNRLLGIVPGLADGIVMAALALTILVTLPGDLVPRDAIARSTLGGPLLRVGVTVQTKALDLFGGAVQSLLPLHTIEPKSGESVRLPFRTADGQPDPAMERRMFALVNQERVRRGRHALVWDDRLQAIARAHSQDMLKRGYFSHYSPEGKTVVDRVAARGLHFQMVGENLALAPTLAIAHEGLMKSPGHRANILHKEFRRIGIGAIVARPYGIMITQVFAR